MLPHLVVLEGGGGDGRVFSLIIHHNHNHHHSHAHNQEVRSVISWPHSPPQSSDQRE